MDLLKRKDLILRGNTSKVLITLAIPIMINNVIQCLYNMADGFWVSMLGSVQFAATSFVWPIDFLFISIGSGISIAGTSLLSRLIGANNTGKAQKYSTHLVVISILSSLVFTIIGIVFSSSIISLMGASGDLQYYSNIYLKITILSLPLTFYYFVFNSIMVAQGNTVVPTLLSGISAIINIVLDPILMFPLNLGISGAAYATVLSKLFLCIAAFIILKRSKSAIKPSFKNFYFDINIVKRIFSISIPSSIGQSGSSIGFIVLNTFITSYGTSTLAAYGMVNKITSLISMPAMGFGAALVTVVGQNLGNGNISRVEDAFKKASIIVITITTIGSILMYLNGEVIINFFMQSKDDLTVIEQGLVYFKYILYSMPLMGMFSIFQGIFQGSGYTKYSMHMSIGRLWFVRLPLILLFKNFTEIGSSGIWFSMSFSNLVICLYGLALYRKGRWLDKFTKLNAKSTSNEAA